MPLPVRYLHVDVFSPHAYSGNSLAVFTDAMGLTGSQMALITRELRHFEAIFLERAQASNEYRARVFDLLDELDFAGHPVIGAACSLHAMLRTTECEKWTIRLKARTVAVETRRRGPARFFAVLDQGPAEFLGIPPGDRRDEIASWFSLTAEDLDDKLPPEVVSTGLRYLVLPVRQRALCRASIACPDLETKLAGLGAQFAYLLDAEHLQGRHWNNDGVVEDVATGSGAGCVAAYLLRRGRIGNGEAATLNQGRFVGRPSEIAMRAYGRGTNVSSVEIGGDVAIVGCGQLDVLPVAS